MLRLANNRQGELDYDFNRLAQSPNTEQDLQRFLCHIVPSNKLRLRAPQW